MIYSTEICNDCPLRLYNDKCYNIKGIGTIAYSNLILISNVDKLAYKAKDLSFSKQIEVLNELCVPSTGELVTDFSYITPLIKCKETSNLIVNDDIINRCKLHLVNEINYLKPKRILLLGSAVKRMLHCSIEEALNKIIVYNGIAYNVNYSPLIELFDANKFELFKEHFIKWVYSCKTNNYFGYEIINYD